MVGCSERGLVAGSAGDWRLLGGGDAWCGGNSSGGGIPVPAVKEMLRGGRSGSWNVGVEIVSFFRVRGTGEEMVGGGLLLLVNGIIVLSWMSFRGRSDCCLLQYRKMELGSQAKGEVLQRGSKVCMYVVGWRWRS